MPLAEVAVRLLVAVMSYTWRVEVRGECHLRSARDSGKGIVFVLWHAEMVPLLRRHRHQSMWMMISRGRDGQRLSSIVKRWGYRVLEGSSTRGGTSALKKAIGALRKGEEVAITPDGPTGPPRLAKPGAIQAAASADALVVPVASAAKWNVRLGTWDGFVIPLPFSRIVISYGLPYVVERNGDVGKATERLTGLIATTSRNAGRFEMGNSPLPSKTSIALRLFVTVPMVPFYYAISTLQRAWRSRCKISPGIRSIVIGGPTYGGDGKTPVAAWIARVAKQAGAKPAIVMRGYGGDENLVHGELNPDIAVVCDANRMAGCDEAMEAGANVVVLDDALQRTELDPTLTIGVVAAERVLNAGFLLPAGSWREPIGGLVRADCVVVTYKTASANDLEMAVTCVEKEVGLSAAVVHLAPGTFTKLDGTGSVASEKLRYKTVLACAAVAVPEAFFHQLEMVGVFVFRMPFRDHHHFPEKSLKKVVQKAKGVDYVVVTQKDAVKLRGRWPAGAPEVLVANLELLWVRGERELAARVSQICPASNIPANKNNTTTAGNRLVI